MSTKIFTPREAALAVLAKAEELYKSSNLAKGDWAKIHSKLKREGYSEESADKIDGSIKAKMGKSEEELAKAISFEEGQRRKGASQDSLGSGKIKNATTSGVSSLSPGAHVKAANNSSQWAKHPESSTPKIHREIASDHIKAAKAGHKDKLKIIQGQPKPNLGKSEENPDAKADANLGEKVEQDVHQHEEQNEGSEQAEPQMKGHMKLAKFMGRMDYKKEQKAKEMDKSEHQPHPGPTSLVPSYGAANQAASEAHLQSPKGNEERMQANKKMMESNFPKKK